MPLSCGLLAGAIALSGAGPAVAADAFERPEPGERYPGGSATYRGPIEQNAFSRPSANLPLQRRLDFRVGNALFERLWVSAPASTQAADGLGPLYSARACHRCHINDGRGHPPQDAADNSEPLVLRLDIPPQDEQQRADLAAGRRNNIPEPTYGSQLQGFAITGHRAEYRLDPADEERVVTLADGTVVTLRKATYRVTDLAYGPLHPQARLSPRVAPQLIGLGLLAAVDASAILALADPDDLDGDGISGRANRVWSREHGRRMLGRFGHKAGMPTLNEQVQHAFANDIGISVPLYPDGAGDCTAAQAACREAPNGNSAQYGRLEAGEQVTRLVRLYASNLAVPARRDIDHPDVLAGKRIFHRVGCAGCHTPQFETARDRVAAEHAGQRIWPYTDLLLHDLGEDLADHRPEGLADGREWRTAPLWGIGLTERVTGRASFLHDGRARSLLEAILWHGGEAQRQRDAVVAMAATERAQLLRFIESL